jgi:MarR family transcriptional regulator, organic hydroperoxide resistance regulator
MVRMAHPTPFLRNIMAKQKFPIVTENLLKLENQLCFMLYSASRKMTAAYRPLLSELDITYPQYLVLMVLWEYFDITGINDLVPEPVESKREGMKVGALSLKLQLDNGTLTPLLKRMEQQGLLVRKRDEQDERVVRINLTESGIALRERACKIPEKLLCESGLTGDELKGIYSELSGVLKKIPGIM